MFKVNFMILYLSVLVSYCNVMASNKANDDTENYPFNRKLYEDVLNSELCQKQLSYIMTNKTQLLLRFYDAGMRIPKGVFLGNTLDLGNYHECLNIRETFEDRIIIQGKYCLLNIALNQTLQMNKQISKWTNLQSSNVNFDINVWDRLKQYDKLKRVLKSILVLHGTENRLGLHTPINNINLRLAICIPATCTTREAISALYFNVTRAGFEYEDEFCRLPNDKPWVTADLIAIVIFSAIGLLVIASTCYDLQQSFILKKDPKQISTVYRSFSAYTNAQRLVTYKSGSDTLQCIDGIRALAMAWVVIGHIFIIMSFSTNVLEAYKWATSIKAIWITAAPITVDTFFMLSGLLVVYTTAGKFNTMQLLKNLPLFYLIRLLRMCPILAAMILYMVSFHNRIFDGPLWNTPAKGIFACRQYWWSALLHIQNYYNPKNMCIEVTWYLSVDVQLHLLSPLILFWVLSSRKSIAWIALTAGLIISLVSATVYNFMNNFQSGSFSLNLHEIERYHVHYYINTLTRTSPFFVGMINGYILYLWKGKGFVIPKSIAYAIWGCVILLLLGVMYCVRLNLDVHWDNQTADNILNSFMRPAWAIGLGWLIFACVKGYGGPLNWLLCLNLWKLPARLSYAIYIIHFPIIMAVYSSSDTRTYFSISKLVFEAAAFLLIITIAAFMATIIIDAPFATLLKLVLSKEIIGRKSNTRNNTDLQQDGK